MMAKTTNYTKFLGLQGFLNLLLFRTYIPPELIDGKYYSISEKVAERFNNTETSFPIMK